MKYADAFGIRSICRKPLWLQRPGASEFFTAEYTETRFAGHGKQFEKSPFGPGTGNSPSPKEREVGHKADGCAKRIFPIAFRVRPQPVSVFSVGNSHTTVRQGAAASPAPHHLRALSVLRVRHLPHAENAVYAEPINVTVERSGIRTFRHHNNRTIRTLPPPATGKSNHGRRGNRLRPDAEGNWKFSLRTSIGPSPEIFAKREDGQYRARRVIFQTAFRVPRSGFPRAPW